MEEVKLEVRKSAVLDRWLDQLKDKDARGRISARLLRLADGHWGDVRSVGDRVFELRVDCGPGYRIYGTEFGRVVVLLLCGGDKTTQRRDIVKAKRMVDDLQRKGGLDA